MKIEEQLLNELIPVPDKFEKAEEIRENLIEKGFPVSYWENGGVFKTIVMVFLLVYEELIHLLRYVLLNSYLATATGKWLDVKANDFSRYRKKAKKTIGRITLKREKNGQSIVIPMGYVFKTNTDSKGREYRFFVEKQQYMQSYENETTIEVVAEKEGEEYNLPPNTIVRSLQFIPGITEISNKKDWIVKEGSSEEDDESFRERTMDWYDELAQLPTGLKFRAIALAVEGVIQCYVDDLHPRGQGTIDIILISSAGVPTQALIDEVKSRVDKVKGPYDDIQYISPEIKSVSVEVMLSISKFADETTVKQLAKETIEEMMKKKKGKTLNCLYQSHLISELMKLNEVENVRVISPSADLELNNRTVLQLQSCKINIKKV